jgi:sigma-B regulation protein RsbU (phosphoserine phosphatase)
MPGDGANPEPDPLEEDFRDLYDHAPCGYLSTRPHGAIVKCNATFAAWMGSTPDQLSSKRLRDLLNVPGRIFYETHFAPLLRMQGFFNEVALDLVTRDGNILPVLVNAIERRDAEGRHLFTRMVVFNATDRRRYERELVAARAAAVEAQGRLRELNAVVEASLLNERETSALREQFIAVLGHDLRNPLSALITGSQLLLRTPLNERATTLVNLMQRSATRMDGLIENVMDFARGRLGGGLTLERDADEPIEPVLRQVVSELQMSEKTRVIETRMAITEPVNCDRRRVGQLASNLLGNALTHGAADRPITFGAATANGIFELYVANAGAPIPAAVMKSIFQPFSRGSLRPSLQGLGLGYISRIALPKPMPARSMWFQPRQKRGLRFVCPYLASEQDE